MTMRSNSGGTGGGGGGGAFVASYTGNDAPGAGANTLDDGESRFWNKVDTAQSFLVLRVGAAYRLVELS